MDRYPASQYMLEVIYKMYKMFPKLAIKTFEKRQRP